MRIQYLTELIIISLILVAMIVAATLKRKKFLERTSTSIFNFLLSIIIPLAGNSLAFLSGYELFSSAGYTLMLLGDCFLVYNLGIFVMDFCDFRFKRSPMQFASITILATNSIMVLLNPFFHHMYTIRLTYLSDGSSYYALDPGWGMLLGFGLLQALFVLMIAILINKCLKISSAYFERYIVIMIAVFSCMGFLFFVFAERPVNKTLIGYCICGFLLYVFTFIYKPFFIRRRLADSVVEYHTDGIIFYDVDVNALYANDKAYEILHIKSDKGNPDKCTDKLLEIMGGADLGVDFDIAARFKENSEYTYVRITHRLMKDKRDKSVGSFFSIHDETEQVNLNARRKYLATHDELTGLNNRLSFEEEVNGIIKANPDTPYYMIVSDINDFKMINDVFGRETADKLLVKMAGDIEKFSHPGSAICRWRGDIFCAFAKKSIIDLEALEKLVKDIWAEQDLINSPVVIHIGIFETSGNADEVLTVAGMVDRAQLAIAGIKNDFNRCIAIYDDKLRKDKLWEQQITNELASAIADGQIIPYLQPQYAADGRLEGGEVLVRWNHPVEGLLSPFKFIPIFEKNGLIATIDAYIWEEACKILNGLAKKNDGHEKLNLSINISPKDFYFLDIYQVITGLVEKYGVSPNRLHLEITESSVMNNATEHIKQINSLRDYGFTVEMDDFGSGYSSLNMLKDMPVDILKIDMVFLGKTADFKKSKIILSSIVNMANNLDMPQITEGVETREQFDMLKAMGCKLFQGYFFSKPVPLDEFEKLPLIWE